VDRVDEDHRIYAIEGSGLPVGHLREHPVGDVRDRVLRHPGPIDLSQMRRHLTRREALRRQRQHQLIDTIEAPLTFADDLRIERRLAISRDIDLDRSDLGHHRLRPLAVPRVRRPAASGLVAGVAQVLVHLALERRLQHPLRQITQQTTGTGQRDPLHLGLLHQPQGELLFGH